MPKEKPAILHDPEQAKELNQKIAHNYLMYSDWYK